MQVVHLQDFDEATETAIRHNGGIVNIVVDTGNLRKLDLDLFFGPVPDSDVFVVVAAGTSWAHVLAGLGCFPSVNQARKNGWHRPIEPGFTNEFRVGKAHRKFLASLNITDGIEEEAPGKGEFLLE